MTSNYIKLPSIVVTEDISDFSKQMGNIGTKARAELYESLRHVAERVSTMLRSTTDHWDGDKPEFPRRGGFHIKTTGNDVSISIEPEGSELGVSKWVWLDGGTDERWAKLSRDWQSKTTPGEFASGRGRGQVLLSGRDAYERSGLPPDPGIEARNWSVMAAEEIQREMGHVVDVAISKALAKAGL